MDMKIKTLKKKAVSHMKAWSLLVGLLLGAFLISSAIILILFDITDYGVSFAAIGASVFTIFFTREGHSNTSYKTLYGAYSIAAVCGYMGFVLGNGNKIAAAFSLLAAMIFMILFSTVHAPAVGFVLSFVFHDFTVWRVVAIVLSVFSLILIAKIIRHLLAHPVRYRLKVESKKINFKFKKKDRPKFLLLRQQE